MEPKFVPIYSAATEKLIQTEFTRLKDKCYLDHSGATLYSEKLIGNVLNDLQENLFGNPHAQNTASKLSEDIVDQIRFQVLQHFNTTSNDYSVIFTSSATQAIKIVGECFNYNGGELCYLNDNHTSVLGMRAYINKSNCLSHYNAFKLFEQSFNQKQQFKEANSLFVYPAQCNFSGFKYPLGWIEKVQKGILNVNTNWFCLLDAASFAGTNDLNLSKYKPDFVSISFYKMFGYPSGLGALLVKNTSNFVLEKRYYGGGTVFLAMSEQNEVVHRKILHERFEDGTLPFLSIISLRHCFASLKCLNLNMDLISRHTFSLAKYVYDNMITIHHSNGNPIGILYHDTTFQSITEQGGVVNFNLLRDDGSYIGYSEVMNIFNLFNIYVRTGCFCNPGACQRHLRMTSIDVKHNYKKGHVCGDQIDLIDSKPTGSVRISFGYMSTKKDADEFLNTIIDCFVTKPMKRKIPPGNGNTKPEFKQKLNDCTAMLPNNVKNLNGINGVESSKNSFNKKCGVLQNIFVYPVKSCGAYSVEEAWKLVETGLQFDREWMIVSNAGVCLTQKQEPRMCMIRPIIDFKNEVLVLTCRGFQNISTPLNLTINNKNTASICQSKVCLDNIEGVDCGNEVSDWLVQVLNRDGLRLLKQSNTRSSKDKDKKLSLVNKSQFLMLNKASVLWLMSCISEQDLSDTVDDLINRFRPNFVIDFGTAFAENDIESFLIGQTIFKFEDKCTRCQMICINQGTGDKSVEPLRTLSKEFNGKISFGIYLRQVENNQRNELRIHSDVKC